MGICEKGDIVWANVVECVSSCDWVGNDRTVSARCASRGIVLWGNRIVSGALDSCVLI